MSKIIIVDDEEQILEILEFVLKSAEKEQYEIIRASSGHGAITMAKEIEDDVISLIITDYSMPDGMGSEFINNIRGTIDPAAKIPVIFLSAFVKDAQLALLDIKNVYFVAKPININVFKVFILKILEINHPKGPKTP
jgi:CheY-like chemotaxis protein